MPARPPSLKQRPRAQTSNWNRRASRQARGYGREHDAMRARVLREEPLCRHCLADDRFAATKVADHITPKAEGGTDERENYQGLCDPCHRAKIAEEAKRGRARSPSRC